MRSAKNVMMCEWFRRVIDNFTAVFLLRNLDSTSGCTTANAFPLIVILCISFIIELLIISMTYLVRKTQVMNFTSFISLNFVKFRIYLRLETSLKLIKNLLFIHNCLVHDSWYQAFDTRLAFFRELMERKLKILRINSGAGCQRHFSFWY